MEELTYKDLSQSELDSLKDMYVDSRLMNMSEDELKKFVREIIEDQIKGTVGNAEEKEAWKEMKEHFAENLSVKIEEIKSKNNNKNIEIKSPEEIEFDKRLSLLKKQQEIDKISADMWEDE